MLGLAINRDQIEERNEGSGDDNESLQREGIRYHPNSQQNSNEKLQMHYSDGDSEKV